MYVDKKQELQHPDAVKYTLDNKVYQEFNKENKVVFTKKLKHSKSVCFEGDDKFYSEYDKWSRTTFHKSSSGFWCLKFYEEPTSPDRVNVTPFQVIHQSWHLYNDL